MPNLRILPIVSVLALSLACGGDAKKADTKAEKKDDKAEKKEEKKEAEPAPKKDELAHPWAFEDIRESLRGGATLVYKQSGTNAKGKQVEDDYKCEIKKSSGKEVGTVCDGVNHPSDDKGATQVAMQEWSQYSPFFGVQRAEQTLIKREEITVPAGTFDCVNADLKGFFGNSYTVWMIADKPGIYAKVIKHPNAGEEDDKTEMTFELAEMTLGKGGGEGGGEGG